MAATTSVHPRRLAIAIVLGSIGSMHGCKPHSDGPNAAGHDAGSADADHSRGATVKSSAMLELFGLADAAPSDGPADAKAPETRRVFDADAGTSTCKLLYGPEPTSFHGPAALRVRDNTLELVMNERGTPRAERIQILVKDAKSPLPRTFAAPPAVTWPPCVLAGRDVYCTGKEGVVIRHRGSEVKEVAHARPGTRIAAALLGGEHSVVAYLASRVSTGGASLEAYIAGENGNPIRLSEDGTGATAVTLVSRGEKVVALTIDARAAMTPIHARHVAWNGGPALESDAVLYVGGSPEKWMNAALAVTSTGATYALVPLGVDTLRQGMFTIAVDDPPKDDAKTRTEPYAASVDSAPIATVTTAKGVTYVARVRPLGARASGASAQAVTLAEQPALELGVLAADGAFTSFGIVESGKSILELAMVADAYGTLWILYGDGSDMWLERRSCTAGVGL